MRRFFLKSFLLVTTLASAISAQAQFQFSDVDIVLGRLVFLAFRPDVKAELKVTPEQYSKMTGAFGDSLEVDGERMSIRLTGSEDLEAMEKDALKVLDEAQTKRLAELRTQYVGALVLGLEKPAKEVGLSEDQRKEVAKIMKSTAESLQDLFSGGHSPEMIKDSEAIRKKSGERVLALLNEDQRKRFEGLKGKEFKFKTPDKPAIS